MAGKTGSKRHRFPGGAQRTGRIVLLLFILVSPGLSALAGYAAAAQNDTGQLEVRLKDHREAIGDFSRVTLKIDKVSISPNAGLKFWQTGWQDLAPSVATVDLTKYVGNKTVTIFKGSLAAGDFDAINLKLAAVEGILKKTNKSAQIKNTVGAIKLPFSIRAGSTTVIVLDLAVEDVSDHPPLTYQLGIGGWELYSNGKLVDKVPPG
jgi:Domain of unknown function (DUF4382)